MILLEFSSILQSEIRVSIDISKLEVGMYLRKERLGVGIQSKSNKELFPLKERKRDW